MKDKKVIKIVVIIVVLLLIAFIGFKLYKSFNNKNNNSNNIDDIYDFKKITSDEKSFNGLLNAIPYSNETMGVYKDAYSQDKTIINDVIGQAIISSFISYNKQYTTKDDMEDYIKFSAKNSGFEVEEVYKTDLINEMLFKNYNINLKTYDVPDGIEMVDLDLGYCAIKYDKKDSLKQAKITIEMPMTEINGEIIIKEKAVFVVLKGDTYYVYKDSNINDGQEPLKTFSSDNKKIYEIHDLVKEDFKDYKTVFKHTFRKNEFGYYWYSTELVKNN